MSGVVRLICIVSAACIFAGLSAAQDLGSSNRLFGGGKKTTTAPRASKPKTSAAKPKTASKTTAKKSSTKPKAAEKQATKKTEAKKTTPAKETTAKKPAPVKKDLAKASTEKKPTTKKPVEKPVPSDKTIDGRFASFRASDKPVTESSKRLYDQLLETGNRARGDRHYSSAETAYKKAAALDPRDARAVYALGTIYSDQQRWEEAEAAYRAALKIDANDVITTIALSYVLTQPLALENLSDRYAEAETLARKAIKLAPNNPLAHDQLGVSLELRGLTGAETEAAYRKAIDLAPHFAPAHAHLGRLLRRRGQTPASRDAYANALDKAKDAASLIVIAEVLQSEQRYADSEEVLRRALDDDPRNAAGLLLLGRALTVSGDHADAEIMLRRAIDVTPDAYMPNVLLATLYLRQSKHGQAEAALFQASRWVPDGERMPLARQFEELGDAYYRGGKLANAQRAYREALRLNSKNLALKDKIARSGGS